jgi:hypothetical protein
VPLDSRQSWRFRHPLDVAALIAEFDFAEGVRVVGGPSDPGRIEFDARSGGLAFVIAGSGRHSFWSSRGRAAWWREWRAHPAPRRTVSNPFGEMRMRRRECRLLPGTDLSLASKCILHDIGDFPVAPTVLIDSAQQPSVARELRAAVHSNPISGAGQ